MTNWVSLVPAIAIAVGVLVLPGLAVLLAGWRASFIHVLTAPVVSVGILAVTGVIGGALGIPFGLPLVAATTGTGVMIALLLRKWSGFAPRAPFWSGRSLLTLAGVLAAAVLIGSQCVAAFISPDNISQTFDNIVHLNSAAFGQITGNVSPFHIGATSDSPFYPNGWHAVTVLVAEMSGVSIPQAVNATNLAIASCAWPMGATALAWVIFPRSAVAPVATALLSTAFGAFPMLLLSFGVLYPNVLGYAMVSPALAAVIQAFRVERRTSLVVREAVLLLAVSAGVGLAHPSAYLALLAFIFAWALAWLVRVVMSATSLRSKALSATAVCALAVGLALVWHVARTPFEMSRWSPWQRPAQAFGEGVLVAPNGLPMTLAVTAVLIIGIISAARGRSRLGPTLQFAVGVLLFVLVAGFDVGHPVREFLTNPWYNDPYRLAALLPIAALPIATLGVVTIWEAVRRPTSSVKWARRGLSIAGVLGLAVATQGPSVAAGIEATRLAYTYSDNSALLTTAERELLERIETVTPDDALIAGNPRTGVALAYALGGREVLEKHVFGQLTDEERYLNQHLSEIDNDPLVCEAVRETGVDFVLDFGRQDVHNAQDSIRDYDGIQNLVPSESLELVDQEGDSARLFRVVGC